MDVVFLSRLQFALATSFHILFPTLTIGLALFLVIIEFQWLRTRNVLYYRMYRFWVKIFAIHFAVGVVSGITLEFMFGTNFARFSQSVANVIAPLLAYEGMTAFFLEAGFLGIMLFGWKRVSPTVHFLSTCMVALGATLSAFWIMAANAWMQTPAGYELIDGQFYVTSFWEAIFNPSFPSHLLHMLLASYETTAFAVAGICAFFILRGSHTRFYSRSMAIALIMGALVAPLQIMAGHLKGEVVGEHQPAKLAAMEAHWETNHEGSADFVLFGIPDMENERNRFEVTIPGGLGLLLKQDPDATIQGLTDFPRDERPNVGIVFWTFRIMVGIGFVFMAVMLWAAYLWWKKRLYESPAFLKTLVVIQPLGFVATVSGWLTAEIGRQPWIVYGLMRTSDGVSPIAAGNVLWSMFMFGVFFAVIGASYLYFTVKALRKGPDMHSPLPPVQIPAGMRPVGEALGEVGG